MAAAEEIAWTSRPLPPTTAPSVTAYPAHIPAVALGRPMAAVASEPFGTQPPAMLDPQVTRASLDVPVTVSKDIWKAAKGSEPASAAEPVRMLPDSIQGPPVIAQTARSFAVEAEPVPAMAEPGGPLLAPGSPWCDSVLGAPAEGEFGESPGAPGERFYARAEYLLWWFKEPRVPVLVTTGPPESGGILGMPGTQILFGGGTVDEETRSGARFTAGYWLDDCQRCGVEGSFFFIGDRTARFLATSDQFPVLARPFFNLNQGLEFSQITAGPGLSTGRLTVNLPSRLWGAEGNVRHAWCCGCDYRVDWLAGFRYLHLDESLDITEFIQALPTAPAFANDQIFVNDHFATKNQFYGGQLGLDAEIRRGRWFLEALGKIALGDTHQVVDINGSQLIVPPNGPAQSFQGGLLALSSNIGHHTRDRFAVVPEININIGYQLTDHVRAFIGYDFLYWSNVVRPGDQIDRGLDVTRIPNFPVQVPPLSTPRPAVLFKETDFWAQGINFGLEVRY
jgi:hypothetical protein